LQYEWVSAEVIERSGTKGLEKYDGLIVPGGFGTRGIEGKITAATYALAHKKPYLGLCLGLQVAVIAAARLGGVRAATSGELDPDAADQVVYIMADQKGKEATGGTMRLGDYPARLTKGSMTAEVYGTSDIIERHRHRYEVNRTYEATINRGGLVISGESPDGRLVEFVEAVDHPYFLATQAHPEFRSRPTRPHPLFVGFIRSLQ
jgi:CTP synthase